MLKRDIIPAFSEDVPYKRSMQTLPLAANLANLLTLIKLTQLKLLIHLILSLLSDKRKVDTWETKWRLIILINIYLYDYFWTGEINENVISRVIKF